MNVTCRKLQFYCEKENIWLEKNIKQMLAREVDKHRDSCGEGLEFFCV